MLRRPHQSIPFSLELCTEFPLMPKLHKHIIDAKSSALEAPVNVDTAVIKSEPLGWSFWNLS